MYIPMSLALTVYAIDYVRCYKKSSYWKLDRNVIDKYDLLVSRDVETVQTDFKKHHVFVFSFEGIICALLFVR